ncbi:MAG: RNA 2',3'-cyclic phosphodiesterase [Desulfohalobiaceae bacterium]
MPIRCFVGLELPQSYQEGLQEIVDHWRHCLRSRVSWTRKGNWHLTLCFLGQISQEQLQGVKSSLQQVRMPVFEMQAKGGGFFPPGKKPRVIWAGVESGAQECSRLASLIAQAVQPLGQDSGKQPFKPHLTLGRVKQAKEDDWKGFLEYLQNLYWPRFSVDSFCLWQSTLKPTGPEYSLLQRYPLQQEQT